MHLPSLKTFGEHLENLMYLNDIIFIKYCPIFPVHRTQRPWRGCADAEQDQSPPARGGEVVSGAVQKYTVAADCLNLTHDLLHNNVSRGNEHRTIVDGLMIIGLNASLVFSSTWARR